jgi:hypothetical protein
MPANGVVTTEAMVSLVNLVARARANRIRRAINENAAPGVRTSENGYTPTETPSQETPKDAKS